MLLLMTLLHVLGQIDENKVKHDSLYMCIELLPLAPVLESHVANGIEMTSFYSLGKDY